MTGRSTLDPDNLADTGDGTRRSRTDTATHGPSDRSDSGADTAAGASLSAERLGADSDGAGTGERPGVNPRDEGDGPDIDVDRVVGVDEAGVVDTGGDGRDAGRPARAAPQSVASSRLPKR